MDEIKKIFTIKFFTDSLKHPLSVFQYKFIRYLIIGFSSAFIDFALYQLCITYLSESKITANIISELITLIYNFSLTNYWTFQAGSAAKLNKISKYLTLAFFNYLVNNILFIILVGHLGFNALLTKAGIIGLIVCWNFFLYKTWVFKNDK
ncbi:MAG: GtrA family protein [bacterium]